MTEPLDTLIDTTAELRRDIDHLARQVSALGVALIALALAVLILEVKLWRR